MRTADVAALWNSPGGDYNAGFIIVKPATVTVQLYRAIKRMTRKSAETDDQLALNYAVDILQRRKSGLKVATLDGRRFRSGYEYFEKPRRWFPLNSDDRCREMRNYSDCAAAAVVHGNWIVGKAAKVYRFREHLMWYFDGDDQYYTSATRLYLTYSNSGRTNWELFGAKRRARLRSEVSALKTAMTIGYLLNRTVILPRFRIGQRSIENPLNSFVNIGAFDGEFSGKYRENSFLRHPKVPQQVKFGLHEQALVMGRTGNLTLQTRNVTLSSSDILQQFGEVKARVLAIGSVHGVHIVLDNVSEAIAFSTKFDRAVIRSDYRQYTRW